MVSANVPQAGVGSPVSSFIRPSRRYINTPTPLAPNDTYTFESELNEDADLDESSADDLALEESNLGTGSRKLALRKTVSKTTTTSLEERLEDDIITATRVEIPQDTDVIEPLAPTKWEIIKDSLHRIWHFTVDIGAEVGRRVAR